MLSRLLVKNYVLIDSLEIDFPEGLIIITGQTGAGKSILLGALGLVMGAKADASMLSEGADSCVVEAEFDVNQDDSVLKTFVDENDAEWDGGHLIVRRTVNRSGRSRAFLNDSPVSVQVLQDLSAHLVDIHSQHQTLLLSDKRFQLDTLDFFAGTSALCEECSDIWRNLTSLKTDLSELDSEIRRLAGEKDYTEAQYRQLESASLREGEISDLEEEQRQLANAEEIKTGLSQVEELFTSASSGGEIPSFDSSLKEADRILSKLGRFVPSASSLAERIDTCRRELDDILSDVINLNSHTEMSESRLEEVDSRLSFLYGLLHKHGCNDDAELIALREKLSDTLFDSTRLEEQRDSLMKKIQDMEERIAAVSDKLHKMREDAAPEFAASITQSIRDMELPYAVFEVEILPSALGATGKDSIAFCFSSTGKNPVEVSRCASGGELSRIMLSLKAMRARYANMPTMIFDEIDTGVSGSVADKMGSMICDMGQYMQVFAITHLPQVAAKGSAHYLVTKEIDPKNSTAVSKINKLSENQRVLEVARMLSGSVLTDAAIANAKALLEG